jgi:hypothetical protein
MGGFMKIIFFFIIFIFFMPLFFLTGNETEEILCEHPRQPFNGKCYLPDELIKAEEQHKKEQKKAEEEKIMKEKKEKEKKEKAEAEKKKKEELIRKNFPVKKNGFLWSQIAPKPLDHSAAVKYCETLGGNLPTIDQLRTTLTMCKATESNGACKITESCADRKICRKSSCNGCATATGGRYSLFRDSGWFWTSTIQTDDTEKAWYINFNQALIDTNNKKGKGNVRCVAKKEL